MFKTTITNKILIFLLTSYSDSLNTRFDYLRLVFMTIVLTIRGFAFIYTSWYVGKNNTFSILVLLFVARMLLLIMFTNLWIFIWGWDFLGVVSYIPFLLNPESIQVALCASSIQYSYQTVLDALIGTNIGKYVYIAIII